MKFSVRQIPEEGRAFYEKLDGKVIGLADEEDIQCLSLLDAEAFVEKADETCIIKMKVQGRYSLACARCLEPTEQDRSDKFDLYIDIEPQTDIINLDEDIRQELVIALSSVALCQPDCKGICPNCGTNLNNNKCTC